MVSKKKHRKSKKPSSPRDATKASSSSSSWVDRIDFEPTSLHSANDDNEQVNSLKIRIVSWNVLAEAYLSRRSHPNLPHHLTVFQPKKRRLLLKKRLEDMVTTLKLDFLCLQEVDLHREVMEALQTAGYQGISTPTMAAGGASGGRVDACCIYYLKTKWQLVEKLVVRFDDLATLGSTQVKPEEQHLQGLQQSFLRHNMGLLLRLQSKVSAQQQVTVANAHLYWNPAYEYVKLCQAHYLLQNAQEFRQGTPLICCGDFNSQPGGPVHTYLTKASVNAKRVAPWYNPTASIDNNDGYHEEEYDSSNVLNGSDKDNVNDATEQLQSLEISSNGTDSTTAALATPPIRYICDFTLNRFTRWLRILGIDCALETDEEEIQRTKHNNFVLFERCKIEGRTLITTSSKLLLRKDCPSGTFFLGTNSGFTLEESLVQLLLTHGVHLIPRNFLSRCVVCNGSIRQVFDAKEKRRIFKANQAPDLTSEVEEVYECDGCAQGYWWCDIPTSSASRVKSQATNLFQTCLRGGVPISRDDGDLNMFDFVNVEEEIQKGMEDREKNGSRVLAAEQLDVIQWLKEENLKNPCEFQSAYALRDESSGKIVGESRPFTNVTAEFVGLLDYILFEPKDFRQTERLYLPRSFRELNPDGVRMPNGHLLPSNIWPSDHLAVGAELSLSMPPALEQLQFCGVIGGGPPPTIPTAIPKKPHAPRCDCGCVPPVLSLMEMAELRKEARRKRQAERGLVGASTKG